jgi:hypothetical protein
VTVRLPPGAFVDDAATAALIRDAARSRAASDTWRRVFGAMGEDVSLPSLLMGRQMTIFGRRLDEIDGSTALHDELRPSLEPDPRKRRDLGMVASARCLMSPSEIAQAIGLGDARALFDAVSGVAGGGSGPTAIAALRGVRELFDLVRRWRIATVISRELDLDRSFVFALWRQEGALVVAPPASTYAAGPLIRTAEGSCRSPLFFNDADGRRDGFSLTVGSAPAALGGVSGALHEAALKLFMLPAALLAAGEDQIIKPLLHEEDELWVLLKTAAADRTRLLRMETWSPVIWPMLAAAFPGTTKASLAGGGTPALARNIFEVIAGLGSVHIEGDLFGRPPSPLLRAGAPTSESDLSDGTMLFLLAMQERMLGLLDAHPGDQTGAIVSLLSPDEPDDTTRVVLLLCELVKARRQPSTFLALRDRPSMANERPYSDQMAYLRFHLGDALFGKFLVRVGGQLRRLSRAGGGLPRDSAVRRAIEGVSDLEGFHEENQAVGRIFNAMNPLRNVRAEVDQQDTVWRHIGLLDLLRRGPQGAPAWLPTAPTPPALDNAAQAAVQLFDNIHNHNALPAIEAVLFRSPFELVRRMASDGVLPIVGEDAALSPIAKAQSFALLRATFAAAFDRAEMPDKAPALAPQP